MFLRKSRFHFQCCSLNSPKGQLLLQFFQPQFYTSAEIISIVCENCSYKDPSFKRVPFKLSPFFVSAQEPIDRLYRQVGSSSVMGSPSPVFRLNGSIQLLNALNCNNGEAEAVGELFSGCITFCISNLELPHRADAAISELCKDLIVSFYG